MHLPRFRQRLPLAAVCLLLGACTPPASAPPASAPPASPPSASAPTLPAPGTPTAAPAVACDATKAEWALGQPLDEALLERARVDAGARSVRSLKPGQMVTMEFDAERLNVDVDDAGIVTGLRCG